MWVNQLRLANIKCFEDRTISFTKGDTPYRWVTLLGENGSGKSTALQALALLLAGPESVQNLLPRPIAWLQDEKKNGLISTQIHQGDNDPNQHGTEKVRRSFGYSYHVTGSQPLEIRKRTYTEPAFVANQDRILAWLRQNAFTSRGSGWFAAGYGAFRRLTRSNQIIIPSLEPQARFTNFSALFNEDEPLSAFERWMVYLDYRVSKARDKNAERQQKRGIDAINKLLPDGTVFDSVTPEGRICFNVNGSIVPTSSLSDGYRSVLALAGDLVWRLILAFPDSADPLQEEGVALIDELDIHLHPLWQRGLPQLLREQFTNIQFIVATHSPLIAAGAGEDALTLLFNSNGRQTQVATVEKIAFQSVDAILQSPAFGLVSPYSPQTQAKIDNYDNLKSKNNRSRKEEQELQQLSLFMDEARPFGTPTPGSLMARVDKYLDKVLP